MFEIESPKVGRCAVLSLVVWDEKHHNSFLLREPEERCMHEMTADRTSSSKQQARRMKAARGLIPTTMS